jgi:hypothetical protein
MRLTMAVDVSRIRLPGIILKGARALGNPLRGFGASQRSTPAARSLLTPEQFQEELVILNLSGRQFSPEEYSEVLGNYLGISIAIHIIPDAWYPELSRRLALSGRLAELRYLEELSIAAIIVPGSLPPLVLALTILHELGHLAAGDHLIETEERHRKDPHEHPEETTFATARVEGGRKLARGFPLANEDLREHEANLRASYALVAGCLGSESPYAHDMYNVL